VPSGGRSRIVLSNSSRYIPEISDWKEALFSGHFGQCSRKPLIGSILSL
jgi:hypothetical protein